MGLSILPPVVEDVKLSHSKSTTKYHEDSDVSMSDDDEDDDDSGRPSKRVKLSRSGNQITIPGEVVTDDVQWMR